MHFHEVFPTVTFPSESSMAGRTRADTSLQHLGIGFKLENELYVYIGFQLENYAKKATLIKYAKKAIPSVLRMGHLIERNLYYIKKLGWLR